LPEFKTMALTVAVLKEEGDRLCYEQDMVNNTRLSLEYMGIVEVDSEEEEEEMEPKMTGGALLQYAAV
jgi:hypothetical protein